MKKYLGETIVDIHKTEYVMYTPQDWVLLWIAMYGGIDGSHHKDWVLDQCVRILKGTKVIVKLAKWADGTEEFRFSLDKPTVEYQQWVMDVTFGEYGENTYDYSIGIAP